MMKINKLRRKKNNVRKLFFIQMSMSTEENSRIQEIQSMIIKFNRGFSFQKNK